MLGTIFRCGSDCGSGDEQWLHRGLLLSNDDDARQETHGKQRQKDLEKVSWILGILSRPT